ncbi:hypothetical protein D3C78_1863610 [compost metagenome]
MLQADQTFGDMRRNQSDEGDAAGYGHTRADQPYAAKQQQLFLPLCRNAKTVHARFVQLEHVQNMTAQP